MAGLNLPSMLFFWSIISHIRPMSVLDQFHENEQSNFYLKPAPAVLLPLSLLASAVLLLSFFLPWVNSATETNSLLDLAEEFVNYGEFGGWIMALFMVLMPIGAIALAISRLISRMDNRKLDVLSIAFATYVPLLGTTFYLLVMSFFPIFGASEIPQPGLGFVLGLPACLILLVDAIIQLNRSKSAVSNYRGVALWGILTGLLWLPVLAIVGVLMDSFTPSSGNPDLLAGTALVLSILFSSFTLVAMLSLHRKRNLNGQLSLDRSVGISMIGGLTAGLLSVLFVAFLFFGESDTPPVGIFLAAILMVIIFYSQSAFFIGSVVGAFMATPPSAAPIEEDALSVESPSSEKTNFYDEL